MTFITLLATAVGIVSAIALVVVGLVEAPWQLLLIGLLAALYGLQRQIWASDSMAQVSGDLGFTDVNGENVDSPNSNQVDVGAPKDAPSTASEEPEGEELIYRGIRYRASQPEHLPPLADGKVEGIYRGQPWER